MNSNQKNNTAIGIALAAFFLVAWGMFMQLEIGPMRFFELGFVYLPIVMLAFVLGFIAVVGIVALSDKPTR